LSYTPRYILPVIFSVFLTWGRWA